MSREVLLFGRCVEICTKYDEREWDRAVACGGERALDGLNVHFEDVLERLDACDDE